VTLLRAVRARLFAHIADGHADRPLCGKTLRWRRRLVKTPPFVCGKCADVLMREADSRRTTHVIRFQQTETPK
jgi:hypothetical protein